MYPVSLTSSSLKEILQLGKAAQNTLLIFLEQSQGLYKVTISRQDFTKAEKQKFKNGLRELVEKKLVSKVSGTLNTFLIDESRISFPSNTFTNGEEKSPLIGSVKRKQFGNKPIKTLTGVNKFASNLRQQQLRNKELGQIYKQFDEQNNRFWSKLEARIQNDEYRRSQLADKHNIHITECDTKSVIIACTDFIEEITNEIYFYDVPNRVKKENELYKKFKKSAWFYNNKKSSSKNTNILKELDNVIQLAKHNQNCIELATNGEKCSCLKTSMEKLNSIIKGEFTDKLLDPSSKSENEILKLHLQDWFYENYPELII
jgi:hypothetical protein